MGIFYHTVPKTVNVVVLAYLSFLWFFVIFWKKLAFLTNICYNIGKNTRMFF